jgi:hypothetical protein
MIRKSGYRASSKEVSPRCGAGKPLSTMKETFAPRRDYPIMTQCDIWYVAFGRSKEMKTEDRAVSTERSTRTFKSEVDAKLFATQILAKGWTASAGTLSPHQPKQTIGPSQIARWAAPWLG